MTLMVSILSTIAALSRTDRIFFAFIVLPPITDRAGGFRVLRPISPVLYFTISRKTPQVNVPKIKFCFL